MARSRHPDKAIEAAIQYGEALGWRVEMSNGHAWGRMFCPFADRSGCIHGIWSTPRNPENHARHLRKMIDACPHVERVEEVEIEI